jgi:quercetin dioxygenase-like cupin family protein
MTNPHLEPSMHPQLPRKLAIAIPLLLLLCGCDGDSRSAADAPADKSVVVHRGEDKVVPQTWGELTWYVSADQHSSATMTVGKCVLRPGQQNPRHYHPNCDEVLHVLSGTIVQSLEDGRTETMHAGDTVSIPAGVHHSAKNIGTEDAVLFIAFSSAHRQVVGE